LPKPRLPSDEVSAEFPFQQVDEGFLLGWRFGRTPRATPRRPVEHRRRNQPAAVGRTDRSAHPTRLRLGRPERVASSCCRSSPVPATSSGPSGASNRPPVSTGGQPPRHTRTTEPQRRPTGQRADQFHHRPDRPGRHRRRSEIDTELGGRRGQHRQHPVGDHGDPAQPAPHRRGRHPHQPGDPPVPHPPHVGNRAGACLAGIRATSM